MEQEPKEQVYPFDMRREIIILDTLEHTVNFAVKHWIRHAHEAIARSGFFYVAVSGGSTPNAIYGKLASTPFKEMVDWSCIKIFWSDERMVSHDHPESNYGMAMKAGLSLLPIPEENIFPMPTHLKPEENAALYEEIIKKEVPDGQFDYVMLGMGDDGHTASLFPRTHALDVDDRFASANYVPEKKAWRLTLTYKAINAARKSIILVTGASKAETCRQVLLGEENFAHFPIQKVGTERNPVLWILDQAAAKFLV